MIKRIGFIAVIVVACLFLLMGSAKRTAGLRHETFQTSGGWGYNILLDKRVIIHQETVPAEATQKGFETKAQAQATAGLVIRKLKQKKMPSVTTEEMERIKEETVNNR